jgi:SUMO ligase MMS21 Smc5/6 complex component
VANLYKILQLVAKVIKEKKNGQLYSVTANSPPCPPF